MCCRCCVLCCNNKNQKSPSSSSAHNTNHSQRNMIPRTAIVDFELLFQVFIRFFLAIVCPAYDCSNQSTNIDIVFDSATQQCISLQAPINLVQAQTCFILYLLVLFRSLIVDSGKFTFEQKREHSLKVLFSILQSRWDRYGFLHRFFSLWQPFNGNGCHFNPVMYEPVE